VFCCLDTVWGVKFQTSVGVMHISLIGENGQKGDKQQSTSHTETLVLAQIIMSAEVQQA